MPDAKGRPYAKLAELKSGDVLIADDGFFSDRGGKDIRCIAPNRKCVVMHDGDDYYVRCAHGRHYVEGQLAFDGSDELVGFYKRES